MGKTAIIALLTSGVNRRISGASALTGFATRNYLQSKPVDFGVARHINFRLYSSDSIVEVTSSKSMSGKQKSGKRRNNSGWKNKKKARKWNEDGEKRPRKKNYRRDNRDEKENELPHNGSYAHPGMKEIASLTPLPDGFVEVTSADAVKTAECDVEQSEKNDVEDDKSETSQKSPKRKVALLLGFLGSNYVGMQMNVDQRTIQAELEQALYRAGCIAKSNYGFPSKYGWSNSARTDKGVHSCAQVCSGKLLMFDEDWNVVREAVDSFLPNDIRLLDIVKTNRKFVAKTARDKARYMFMLPSFILFDRDALRKLFMDQNCHVNQRLASDPLSDSELNAVQPYLIKYRVSEDKLELLRTALKRFEGTHYFHNYTRGKSSSQKSAQRFIMKFSALDPVVDEFGMEWIPTQVTGQSFLLNQIRKMICMASEVARGAADMDIMELSFSKDRIQTGVAPAQGLFLDMSFFDAYNKNRLPEGVDPIKWHENEDGKNVAATRIQEFKEKVVMKHIMKEELEERNFIKYLFIQEFKFDRDTAYIPQTYQSDNDESNSTGDSD